MRRNRTHSVEKKYAGRNQGRSSPTILGYAPRSRRLELASPLFRLPSNRPTGSRILMLHQKSPPAKIHARRTHMYPVRIVVRQTRYLRDIFPCYESSKRSLCYSHSPRRGATFTALNNRFRLGQVRFLQSENYKPNQNYL